MKFWKTTLSVVIGVLVAFALIAIFGISFIGGLASAGSSTPSIPSEGVLKIDMSKLALSEQTTEGNPLASITGGSEDGTIGIYDATRALEIASNDDAVKYIYLLADGASGDMALFEEFRIALSKARDNGKMVISYTENPSNGSYYLASAADKIYMSPCQGGMNTIVGLSSRMIFLKDLLDRLGVNVQLIRHGKYKSAGEMYVRNSPSEENSEQYKAMIGSIWGGWASQIALSRGMSAERFNAIVDELSLVGPEDFVKEGLVDELLGKEDLEAQLANLYGADKYKDIKFMDFGDYASVKILPNLKAKEKIAVIYADGEIVGGSDAKDVAGDRFARIIAKARRDSSVKAVVFRVNSPGGSVFASEKIKDEIDLLRADKPVIASYGGYAASGGYWISNSCDKIFSDASTLTGSIGVFSMIPEFSKTAKDLAHVNVVSVGSNKHSDMYSMMRPFDSQETAFMQQSVEDIYSKFTSIVASGRGLEVDYIDSIAQGRVWAGSDALRLGLVDEIGTLSDAIAYAASVAHSSLGSDLSNWDIASYPKPQSVLEQLTALLGSSSDEKALANTPFEGIYHAFKGLKDCSSAQVYARLPYAVEFE